MSNTFGMAGTRTFRGNITPPMAESKKSEALIFFVTTDIFAGQFQFPPTQMLIVLHLRGTSCRTLKVSKKDVECTFGILKKRWSVLNNGLK